PQQGYAGRSASGRGIQAGLERLPALGALYVVPVAAHLHEQADEQVRLAAAEAEIAEELRVEQVDRLAGQRPPGWRHLGDGAAPVGRVRRAPDQPLLLQPVDQAGDAGLVDLQLFAELVEGQI